MKIARKLPALLLAALLILPLAGCEYQSSSEADEEYDAELEEIYEMYGEEGVVYFEETGEWPDW